jgi:hypothetical protein
LYLTIISFLFLSFHLECNHVDLFDSIMPVTTRSQIKRLSSANHSILEVSPNQTGLKLSDTLPVTSCITLNSPSHCIMVTASGASRFNNLTMAVSSIQSIPDQVALADRGSTCESISKFQNFEFSNGDLSFDIGNTKSPQNYLEIVNMEADCKDDQATSPTSGISDMNTLFAALSAKFTSETDKISQTFKHVVEDQAEFKQEVRAELDALRTLVSQHIPSSLPDPVSQVMQPQIIASSVTTPVVPPTISSGADVQQQMMLMMTESFSKLSAAFSEGKNEPKTDWPKFNGDVKKFRSWYLGILTQLS